MSKSTNTTVSEVLELVERAQALLTDAAEKLSPVQGFADEWSELVAVRGSVKASWDRINERRGQS